MVLTPHVDAIRFEFERGFDQWHQSQFGEPARVEWRNVGGTRDAQRFAESEFANKPNGIGIDCFFGGGQEPYLVLTQKKLTLSYRPPPEILDGIPATVAGVELYDQSFTWYAAALASFGILQNTRLQRIARLPAIKTWEELAQPGVYGWVGAGDPRNSGTMNVMFEAFLQYYGWEEGWRLLTRIGGNVRSFDRVSAVTAKDVALGETAYAFAIDFYAFAQVAAGGRTNLSFLLPEDFTSLNPDGIAILRGAPNLTTAQRFISFVLSEAGQRLWYLPQGHPEGPQKFSIERMPVRPDFYRRYRGESNIEMSPFDRQQAFRYNSKRARDRQEALPALIGAVLIDTHRELKAAWQAVMQRGSRPEDIAALGTVPLSEADLFGLSAKAWKDSAYRNQKKIEWQNWAQAKYRRLIHHPAASASGTNSTGAAQP